MCETLSENIEKLIKAAGIEVTVNSLEAYTYSMYAVVEPHLYKNKMYIELQNTPLGRVDDGGFLLLCGKDHQLFADDTVTFGDKSFVVGRAELIYLFGQPLYRWATLRPIVES